MRIRLTLLLLIALPLAACGGKESGSESPAPAERPAPTPTDEPTVQTFDPTTAGSIRGEIQYAGTAPSRSVLEMDSDAWCKNHQASPALESSLIVTEGKLANAFVWIKSGLEGVEFPVSGEPVVLDQVGCVYTPRIVAVQLGQDVRMLNSDNVLHNVHTRPTINKGRNIAMPSKNMTRDFPFKSPEIMIPVTCDVHPWMRAYINVVEHPCFAVSATDGTFTIDRVPPGDYTLEIRHEELGAQEVQVTVVASAATTVDPIVFQP